MDTVSSVSTPNADHSIGKKHPIHSAPAENLPGAFSFGFSPLFEFILFPGYIIIFIS